MGTFTHKSSCHRKLKTISSLKKSQFLQHFLVNKYYIIFQCFFKLILPRALLSTTDAFVFFLWSLLRGSVRRKLWNNFPLCETLINTLHKQVVLKIHTVFTCRGEKAECCVDYCIFISYHPPTRPAKKQTKKNTNKQTKNTNCYGIKRVATDWQWKPITQNCWTEIKMKNKIK